MSKTLHEKGASWRTITWFWVQKKDVQEINWGVKFENLYFTKIYFYKQNINTKMAKIKQDSCLGSSKSEAILSVFPHDWPHFIWDCFPEHISKVDPVQHDADVSTPLLAIPAVKMGLGIRSEGWWIWIGLELWWIWSWLENWWTWVWLEAPKFSWFAVILLEKISAVAVVALLIAVDDIFLEMIQSHNALTFFLLIYFDAVRDTLMSRVEWGSRIRSSSFEIPGRSRYPRPLPRLRVVTDVFLVGSNCQGPGGG